MTSSHTLEMREKRANTSEGKLFKMLESKCGAYYIDYQDQCPLTHSSHRVGRNYKLCSPLYTGEIDCCRQCIQKRKHVERPDKRRHRNHKLNSRTSPYSQNHYYFTI